MIKTIIFDFGNVFIDLDIEGGTKNTFQSLNIDSLSEEMIAFNSLYEQGLISTPEFIAFYKQNFANLSNKELVDNWNYILKGFPKHRLDFLNQLKASSKYKLILLSNTNELHINWVMENIPFYEEFKNCFDAFYLSHEIHLKKPDKAIFEFVLNENNIIATECLFIDDNKDNIKTANSLNFNTWHINPENEDVSSLFKTKNAIF